jgi:hypothetical protein
MIYGVVFSNIRFVNPNLFHHKSAIQEFSNNRICQNHHISHNAHFMIQYTYD